MQVYNFPIVVRSSNLNSQYIPESLLDKVRIFHLSPQETMKMLEHEGHRKVYIDGGRVIQSFLALGLIQEFVITRVPV